MRLLGFLMMAVFAAAFSVAAQAEDPLFEKHPVNRGAFYKAGDGAFKDIAKQEGTLPMPGRKTALQYRATFSRSAPNMPVIVWSHGAFGSHNAYNPLAEYWASHGYLVLQPTHSDSMREGTAPNVKNPLAFKDWAQRPREVSYLIDQLENLETLIPALKGRVDRHLVGIGGHSFGAHTTMLLAGAQTKRLLRRGERDDFLEKRAKAFVMVSPQGTGKQLDQDAIAAMTGPFLMITGTNDDSVPNDKDYKWRLEGWNFAAAAPDRYLLLIHGAHHGFGGISGTVRFPGAGPADADTLEAVRSAALAMFDAQLRGDVIAANWLKNSHIARATPDGAQFMLLSK
ncbi:MAG: dienelactone hydrolase family protein [Parvibaculum sp.]|uniref:alpha/beta hydrolase family protein n=1 Tax=Parvibaculum sp. TaxID=2024848 RepID=UPI0027308F7D|nr:dienelactone hydrolase family protein [Parvibaculum sp.]MDP2148834.1 dienelactone hydrolase family protein [Parvibaculum sp.]